MKTTEVTLYLETTRSVEGWVFPLDAYLFGLIDEVQKQNQVRGHLFEIGVHHGKSALLLARMRRDEELLGVCDVFGRQDLNLDQSGEGSRELFLSNMKKLLPSVDGNLRVFAMRSDELTAEQTSTHCRFFHIDGGHLPAVVYSDLVTAERAIGHAGVISVDDVFNPNWPGVSEGFFRFMTEDKTSLVPILIGANKVFLARAASAPDYEDAWRNTSELHEIEANVPFTFEHKDWLKQRVLTAIRHEWLDLNPSAAAREHLRGDSWRSRLVRVLLSLVNRRPN
jgi:hypothetical protein